MLCDDLVAYGAPQGDYDLTPILPRIKRAQKFVLGQCSLVEFPKAAIAASRAGQSYRA